MKKKERDELFVQILNVNCTCIRICTCIEKLIRICKINFSVVESICSMNMCFY